MHILHIYIYIGHATKAREFEEKLQFDKAILSYRAALKQNKSDPSLWRSVIRVMQHPQCPTETLVNNQKLLNAAKSKLKLYQKNEL